VFNGRPAWTIGGQLFDPGRVDFMPRLGDVEIWTFTNSTPEPHPIHLHGFRVQILELDGSPPPPGVGNCWKDTVLVPAAGSARLITRFADHTGVYVFHCHVLEHADHAMMAQFEVVP
jgi:FtsP/CotA-like multicopper oxidase with cupredoxin domain